MVSTKTTNQVQASAMENSQMNCCLSSRAQDLTSNNDSLYYRGWAMVDSIGPYHEKNNPKGIVQLGLADNQLSYDLFDEKLRSVGSPPLKEYAGYSSAVGMSEFRKVMATIMNHVLTPKSTIKPEHVFTCDGASSMVEMMAWTLADEGDIILVPSPYYPGFDTDFGLRSGVEIVPVPSSSGGNFEATSDALLEAFHSCAARGKTVRALLASSPSNPLGRVLSVNELTVLLEFCRKQGIHLISDEIYAGSVYSEEVQFCSVLSLIGPSDAPFVHVIYGLAKDFGVPGFRVGACFTRNSEVGAAIARLARCSAVSSLTQERLVGMFAPEDGFLARYLRQNRSNLRCRASLAKERLRSAGIKGSPADAGLFLWVDFSPWLETRDSEDEARLFRSLLEEGRVNLTPGQSCHCAEPGWFRLCFAAVEESSLEVGLQRLVEFGETVASRRQSSEGMP